MHLTTALYACGGSRRTALRHAALRAVEILSFASGAALGAVLAAKLRYAALFVPAAVVLAATSLSFVQLPARRASPEPAR